MTQRLFASGATAGTLRRVTPEQQAALHALLPESERTGDEAADLLEAARRSARRRVENSRAGGAVINALRTLGLSWRDIEGRTGIPQATARRWAAGPPGAT